MPLSYTSGLVEGYKKGRVESQAEIDRLTAALHANRCHPDYTYIIFPKTEIPVLYALEAGGWEMNPEYSAALGDICWRRKKTT